MATLPATLLVRPKPTQIDTIQVDVSTSQTHTKTNTVTKHPVEEGFDITDHVRPEPPDLTMECVISNTPANKDQLKRAQNSGTALLNPFPGEEDKITAQPGYAEGQYAKLERLMDNGTLITVITSLKQYENMEITSLVVKRDAQTSGGVFFTIGFSFIRVVQNKLTRVAVSKDPRAGAKKKTGGQTPTEGAQEESALSAGIDGGLKAKADGKGVGGIVAGFASGATGLGN